MKAFLTAIIFLIIASLAWGLNIGSRGIGTGLHIDESGLQIVRPTGEHIYISSSADPGGDGSRDSPYDEFSDINWTTGGANSIYDWVAEKKPPYINLKRGSTFSHALVIQINGTSSARITIQPYGTGSTPIIETLGTLDGIWSDYGATVTGTWRKATDVNPYRVWIEGNEKLRWSDVSELGGVIGGSDSHTGRSYDLPTWYWGDIGGTKYLVVYSASDPSTLTSVTGTTGSSSNPYSVYLYYASYITLKNIEIHGGNVAIDTLGGHYNYFDSLTIKKSYMGIRVRSRSSSPYTESYNCKITNCTIIGSDALAYNDAKALVAYEGITVGGYNHLVQNNTVTNFGHTGIKVANSTTNHAHDSENNQIISNDISAEDISYGRGVGATGDYMKENIFMRNHIHDTRTRIQIDSKDNIFTYNIIENLYAGDVTMYESGQGLALEGSSAEKDPTGNTIAHNLFRNIDHSAYNLRAGDGSTAKENNVFSNNIIENCGAASSDYPDCGIVIEDDASILTNVFNNNAIDNSIQNKASTQTVAQFNGDAQADSNISDDPELTAIGKLETGSPALNAGDVITGINDGGELDIWGNATDGTPNMGAYQSTGYVCSIPSGYEQLVDDSGDNIYDNAGECIVVEEAVVVGSYWELPRTDYWSNARTSLWDTARNTTP